MDKKVKCRFCQSRNTIKKGFRKTESRGKVQKYFCKDCNRFFIRDEGFFKMKNSPQKVSLCLDLFFKGVSTRQIQEHLQQFYPHNSSHMTIYRWVVKYSKMISKFTDNIKLNVGHEMQVDEMQYHRRLNKYRKGIAENWFIDSIDTKTRFMISSEFAKSREQKEIINVLERAKTKTENQIVKITTDGLTAYKNAIRDSFGLENKNSYFGVQHNVVNASKGEGFNILIERLHNNIRQRTKIFRGFHGSLESANAIMKGYEIYYNFIRKHLTLGKTPSELATDIKLKGNKWLELIKMSC